MISVAQALKIIAKNSLCGKIVLKKLRKSFGLVLAEDVISPINMPPFRQSSMDGYAVKLTETQEYKLVGEVAAGVSKNKSFTTGEAIRIFTGARVPDGADTVVIQEHCTKTTNGILIDKLPVKGANIRPLGDQIVKDEIALSKGTILNEAAVGFLAGLGIEKVSVYKPPKVCILVTGDELQESGKKLEEGEIYESNSITLKLALKRYGIKNIKIKRVEDTLKATTKIIENQLKKCDVLLISGGISVGDYDFVKEALLKNNVEELFYKVNQKPGKPLWFGIKGTIKVFALPGNPASSLTCFYVYVIPVLQKLLGHQTIHLPRKKAIAENAISNPFGKDLFLKGTVENGTAKQLTGQASSMLRSFAICNALLLVPSEKETIEGGEEVKYIPLTS